MLHSSNTNSIICTRLFHGKMHSDWSNGIEILQRIRQHGEKVGYCYTSRLEKTLCKWYIHEPLVRKGLRLLLSPFQRLHLTLFLSEGRAGETWEPANKNKTHFHPSASVFRVSFAFPLLLLFFILSLSLIIRIDIGLEDT
jgi:hypothetical protein